MSEPSIPSEINLTLDQSITLLLASIGMEELSLAHLINAEAEKLQMVLGTLENGQPPPPITSLEDLLAVNNSIRSTLREVIKNQMMLQFKLEDVLRLIEMEEEDGPIVFDCNCSVSAELQETGVNISLLDLPILQADVNLAINICPECSSEGSSLTLGLTGLPIIIGNISFNLTDIASIVCGDNTLTLTGAGTATGLLAGLLNLSLEIDGTAGTVELELLDPILGTTVLSFQLTGLDIEVTPCN
jgi:hypothetical protein